MPVPWVSSHPGRWGEAAVQLWGVGLGAEWSLRKPSSLPRNSSRCDPHEPEKSACVQPGAVAPGSRCTDSWASQALPSRRTLPPQGSPLSCSVGAPDLVRSHFTLGKSRPRVPRPPLRVGSTVQACPAPPRPTPPGPGHHRLSGDVSDLAREGATLQPLSPTEDAQHRLERSRR